MSEQRVAALVDGDNIGVQHAPRVLAQARKLGRLDVVRVYTGATPPNGWLEQPGFRLIHAGAGKNAADLVLCIDAMELALTGGITTFVIAASDRDYTHVALRLRELGLHVLGLGEAKAPAPFRAACSAFHQLGAAQGKTAPGPATAANTPSAPSPFDLQIRAMIARHSQNGSGMPLAQLAPRMHAQHGTRISTYPERNWRAYIAARPALYDLDPRGPDARVRFRPAGFGDG